MNLNSFFDKIFVINLPHRLDRLEKFDLNAKKYGIKYENFPAFNGKTIEVGFDFFGKNYTNEGYFRDLNLYNKSCMGCSISHLNVIELSKKIGYEKILILEDDTEFVDDFNEKFKLFSESFNTKWDLLYFSGTEIRTNSEYSNFSGLHSCYTTHSYGVNINSYDTLIDKIKDCFYYQPLDVSYSQIHSNLKSFITKPILTFQYASFSDIHNCHQSYFFKTL